MAGHLFTPAEDTYILKSRTSKPPVTYTAMAAHLGCNRTKISDRARDMGLVRQRPVAVLEAAARRHRIPCMCCRGVFPSAHPVTNRICDNCKRREATSLPGHW